MVSFQHIPDGFRPYLNLVGMPHTTNEYNDVYSETMIACNSETIHLENSVLFNQSSDVVISEKKKNKTTTMFYPERNINQLFLLD